MKRRNFGEKGERKTQKNRAQFVSVQWGGRTPIFSVLPPTTQDVIPLNQLDLKIVEFMVHIVSFETYWQGTVVCFLYLENGHQVVGFVIITMNSKSNHPR